MPLSTMWLPIRECSHIHSYSSTSLQLARKCNHLERTLCIPWHSKACQWPKGLQ
jgi:hypothetical protein